MPRRIGYWLAMALAAAVLARAGWRGAPGDPATLINKVDVIATVLILAGLPWPVRRRFGPMGHGWLARALRCAGYPVVVALVLIKSDVERFEFARLSGRPSLSGLWLGEVVFLVLLAAYVAGLLAVTAQRPLANPAAMATGTAVGIVLGVTIYVMRPLEGPMHTSNDWVTAAYVGARLLAVPLVCGTAVAAGLAAARRAPRRDSRRPVVEARARHGVVAGLCAGAAAALLVSVLGRATIALAPQEARGFQWSLPKPRLQPGTVYAFEASVSDAAAGYLLVLILFPLFGAGLGAWGGLYGSENPGRGSGGGGRGPDGPAPGPPPPGGGRRLREERQPTALDLGQLVRAAAPKRGSPADLYPLPERRDRTPVALAAASCPGTAPAGSASAGAESPGN